eukprot:2101275-Prymnesium_polylepis.1
MRAVNFSINSETRPPSFAELMPRKASERVRMITNFGKERVAIDYGRIVMMNKWWFWEGDFGRGKVRRDAWYSS